MLQDGDKETFLPFITHIITHDQLAQCVESFYEFNTNLTLFVKI